MEKIIGVGVMLQTSDGSYLLQKRDRHAKLRPNVIAPFGGKVESGESALDCARREMEEELHLKISENDLDTIKLFESHNNPGSFIQMFVVRNVNEDELTLCEGESIVKCSVDEALANNNVTDFTKEVLALLK